MGRTRWGSGSIQGGARELIRLADRATERRSVARVARAGSRAEAGLSTLRTSENRAREPQQDMCSVATGANRISSLEALPFPVEESLEGLRGHGFRREPAPVALRRVYEKARAIEGLGDDRI